MGIDAGIDLYFCLIESLVWGGGGYGLDKMLFPFPGFEQLISAIESIARKIYNSWVLDVLPFPVARIIWLVAKSRYLAAKIPVKTL